MNIKLVRVHKTADDIEDFLSPFFNGQKHSPREVKSQKLPLSKYNSANKKKKNVMDQVQ